MYLSKISTLIFLYTLFSCNQRQDTLYTAPQDTGQHLSPQEKKLHYPMYEFEYEVDLPDAFPQTGPKKSLLFIEWHRREQFPNMINYGKDIGYNNASTPRR